MAIERKLLEQLLPQLRRYARSLTGRADEADELVRQFLQQRPWAGRPIGRLQLFRSLRTFFMGGRRQRARPAATALEESATRWLGRGSAGRQDGPGGLRSAYDLLPREQREVLNLVVMDGMSYEEAGGILDLPAAAVRARVGEARSDLLRRLEASDRAAVA